MDTTPEAQRLCGREAEIEQLSRQMENVADGRPDVLCLEGTGGIGKTSLLLAATALAHRRGFTVLSARAARLEREFSFGIVRQLLEPALFGASAGTRRALLHGPAALAGQVLEAPPSAEAQRADIPATFHALWWLLANLAQRAPVLVAVDDLHWADAPSAQWLAYVARRLRRHQIGVLTTLLGGAADDHLLGHPTAGSPVRHVQVRGLDLDATREVIENALSGDVDPGFVSACHTVTDGNPALLVELLRTVPASGTAPDLDRFGPQELVAAVNTRLRNEDPALHVLARALAALGDTSADLHVVAAVSGLPLAAAADAVGRLVQLNLLTDRPAPAFLHSIVRAAFACQLAPTEPGEAHARAATYLHDIQAQPERVAAYLMEAPPIGAGWAVEVLQTAARRAMAEGAPATAVAYLRRLRSEQLTDQQRGAVMFELANAEIHVDPAAAVRHLALLSVEATDPRQQARIACALAQALGENDRYREAVDVLDQAIVRVEPHDPELAFEAAVQLVSLARHEQQTAPLVASHIADLERRRSGSPGGRRVVDALRAERASIMDLTPAVARRLALAAMHAGPVRSLDELRTFSNVVAALLHIEEFDLAIHLCEEILGDRSRRGLPMATALATSFRAEIRYQLGQLRAARIDAENTLDRLDMLSVRRGILPTLVESTLAGTVIDLGDGTAVAAMLDRYANAPLPPFLRTNFLLHARGGLHAAAGDHRAALQDELECARRLERWDAVDHPHLAWRRIAAPCHAALGEHQYAVVLADQDLKVARKRELPRGLGIALRIAGALHHNDHGTALLDEAVAVLAGSPAVLERARAQAELGRRLHTGDRHGEALTLLHDALATAESCASTPLAATIRATLDGDDLPAGSALTPREHRVAMLAAQGRSNTEIAEALVLTRRTVEFHLTNIYRKLGIARRSQLAHVLPGATS